MQAGEGGRPGALVVNYTPLNPSEIPDELRGTSFDRSPVRSFISDVQSLRQIADSVSLEEEGATSRSPGRSPVRYDRNGRRIGPVSPSKVVLRPLEMADREHVAARIAGIQDVLESKVRELEARVERDLSAERRRVRNRERNLERASVSVASGSAAAVGGQWVPPALNPKDPATLYLKVYKANERLQSEFSGLQSHAEQLAEEAAALEARLRRKLEEERNTTARLRAEAEAAAVAHAEAMEQARLDRLKSLEELKREDEAHEALALEVEVARGQRALNAAADEAAAVLSAAQAAAAEVKSGLDAKVATLQESLAIAEEGLVVAAQDAKVAAAAAEEEAAAAAATTAELLAKADKKRRLELEGLGNKGNAEVERARADWQDEREKVAKLTAELKVAKEWQVKHDELAEKNKVLENEMKDVKAAAIDMMLEHEEARQDQAGVKRPSSRESSRPTTGGTRPSTGGGAGVPAPVGEEVAPAASMSGTSGTAGATAAAAADTTKPPADA